MRLQAKICGISDPAGLGASIQGGARYIGLVFYPRSPRHVSLSLAAELARQVPTGVRVVGLFVEPDDRTLAETLGAVPLDLLQLHGEEMPARVAEIRRSFALPVMKAVKVGSAADLERAREYEPVADRLLFDARPPKNIAALPGGNGLSFDWTLLEGRDWRLPWMLSGGLDAGNLATAVHLTGAVAVDVSSGVEDRPGHKDPEKIRQFLRAAASL